MPPRSNPAAQLQLEPARRRRPGWRWSRRRGGPVPGRDRDGFGFAATASLAAAPRSRSGSSFRIKGELKRQGYHAAGIGGGLKPHQQQEIVTLVKQGKKTAADAARLFGVHPATVSRLLRRT